MDLIKEILALPYGFDTDLIDEAGNEITFGLEIYFNHYEVRLVYTSIHEIPYFDKESGVYKESLFLITGIEEDEDLKEAIIELRELIKNHKSIIRTHERI